MAERTNLEQLLVATNAAAAHARTIWVTFLLFGTYLAITVGSTTHIDLLLENPVTLPLFNVDLDLVTFYWVAPLFLILYHVYTLIAHYILAGNLQELNSALERELMVSVDRERFRQRVHPYLAAQNLAGPARARLPAFAISLTLWITLVVGPVLLLMAFQFRFLPYRYELITWAHGLMILADLALAWVFWPLIRHPQGSWRALPGSKAARRIVAVTTTGLLAAFVLLLSIGSSPFSINLVVTNVDLTEQRPRLSLRDRDLSYGNLSGSTFGKADLSDALLQGARLDGVQLRGATLRGARLAGASLFGAQLEGADLRANLKGANLSQARLHGAMLESASLQGASLQEAELQGATLDFAELHGASLRRARLEGATLQAAQLQGAELDGAQLQGARLRGASVWRARMTDAATGLVDAEKLDTTAMEPWEIEVVLERVRRITDRRLRDRILQGLRILAEDSPEQEEWAEQKQWHELSSLAEKEDYDERLAVYLGDLACSPSGAPWVAAGIAHRVREPRRLGPQGVIDFGLGRHFVNYPEARAIRRGVAERLLEPGCAGAAGMDEDLKERLRAIVAASIVDKDRPPR